MTRSGETGERAKVPTGLSRSLVGLIGLPSLMLFVQPAAGQAVEPPTPKQLETRLATTPEAQRQFARWQKDLDEIVADLNKNTTKSNKNAKTNASALWWSVACHGVAGEALVDLAGRNLILLAIAEVRLGDTGAAAWHWQMAQNLSAKFRDLSFAEFPEVAPFMKENLIPQFRFEHPFDTVFAALLGLGALSQDHVFWEQKCVPPKPKKKPSPRYPPGMAVVGLEGPVVVEAIVDTKGKLRAPVLRSGSGHISFDLEAMEALRHWEYEPCKCAGQPHMTFLTVTVNYTLGR